MTGLFCVYGCQHPLWGGQGLCSGQGDPIDYKCLCGEGYLAVDSDGNPSCVLKSALIGIFSAIAVVGTLASGFLFWQARKQHQLPEPIKLGRRAVLRFRVIVCASSLSWATAIVFGIAAIRVAGNAALLESGMLNCLYIMGMPGMAATSPFVVEMWLESLPAQLLPSNSIAIKLKDLAEKRFLFVQMGVSTFVGAPAVGIMPFLVVLDTVTAARIVDIAISTMALLGGSSLVAMASYLTVMINRAKSKAAPSSRDFYVGAVKTVWTQVSVLSVSAVVQIVAAAVLRLTRGGQGTPAIICAVVVANANLAFTSSVHFGKLGRGASSSLSSGYKKTTVQGWFGTLGGKSAATEVAEAENGARSGTSPAGRTLFALPPLRKERRVVPTAGGEG